MKNSTVLLAILSLSSTAVLAEQVTGVPDGAIPIEDHSEMVRDLRRNSNSEESLSEVNPPTSSMRSVSATPVPKAFVQGETVARTSEAPPIKKLPVMPNPNDK